MPQGFHMKQAVGLVFLGVLICLVLLETGLRVAGFVYNQRYYKAQKQKADYRVFCVGESTTFGVGANDPEHENYPHQLEMLLNQGFPSVKSRCSFDQNIGFNTSQVLYNLPASLERDQPDVVIIMAGINNWWSLNNSNVFLFNKSSFLQNISFRVLGFLDEFRVFKLIKWICLSKRLIKFDVDTPFTFEGEIDATAAASRQERVLQKVSSIEKKCPISVFFEVAEYDIRRMIRECRDRRIAVVICSYPGRYAEALKHIHKKIAREEGVLFVDNSAYFAQLSNREDYFTPDGFHPNAAGYRVMAENIFKHMLEHSLVPGRLKKGGM